MRRTLRRFYAVARLGFYAARYHSKVQAIPQRKKGVIQFSCRRDLRIPTHRSDGEKTLDLIAVSS